VAEEGRLLADIATWCGSHGPWASQSLAAPIPVSVEGCDEEHHDRGEGGDQTSQHTDTEVHPVDLWEDADVDTAHASALSLRALPRRVGDVPAWLDACAYDWAVYALSLRRPVQQVRMACAAAAAADLATPSAAAGGDAGSAAGSDAQDVWLAVATGLDGEGGTLHEYGDALDRRLAPLRRLVTMGGAGSVGGDGASFQAVDALMRVGAGTCPDEELTLDRVDTLQADHDRYAADMAALRHTWNHAAAAAGVDPEDVSHGWPPHVHRAFLHAWEHVCGRGATSLPSDAAAPVAKWMRGSLGDEALAVFTTPAAMRQHVDLVILRRATASKLATREEAWQRHLAAFLRSAAAAFADAAATAAAERLKMERASADAQRRADVHARLAAARQRQELRAQVQAAVSSELADMEAALEAARVARDDAAHAERKRLLQSFKEEEEAAAR